MPTRGEICFGIIFLITNITISMILNGFYVYLVVADTPTSSLFWVQLSVALFRLLWGKLIDLFINNEKITMGNHMKVYLLISAHILNNVIAPALAFILTDPSCFVDLLIKPDRIESKYAMSLLYTRRLWTLLRQL